MIYAVPCCTAACCVAPQGLVCKSRTNLQHHKEPFAHDVEFCPDLLSAIRALKPTALVGVSTISKAFNREVVDAMCELNDRPIIFPLSNPTSKAECTFEEAFRWVLVGVEGCGRMLVEVACALADKRGQQKCACNGSRQEAAGARAHAACTTTTTTRSLLPPLIVPSLRVVSAVCTAGRRAGCCLPVAPPSTPSRTLLA